MNALMNTYARLPFSFERGEGLWLYDQQGQAYLDALAGIAVCNLGHAHPAVSQAICQQAQNLVHTSNLYGIPLQERLGEQICAWTGMDKVFFANSGAEANEALIKLARLHGHQRGFDQPLILVMEQSFHGRTLASLSATGNPKIQKGFEPLLPGFVRLPYDDLAAVRQAAQQYDQIAAILVEPVQGEGGVNIPAPDYLAGLRQICDEYGWLLMLDEVQTGLCRTGQPFAFQHTGIQPDAISLAKALGNGVPIGACLARGPAAELFQPGSHGSTFGGNPLACAAALAVIQTMQQEQIWLHVQRQGDRLQAGLEQALSDLPAVVDIRHQGLMIGIELDRPCAELVLKAAEQQKLLINVTADKVIRLLPPLIINDAQSDDLVQRLSQLIHSFLRS